MVVKQGKQYNNRRAKGEVKNRRRMVQILGESGANVAKKRLEIKKATEIEFDFEQRKIVICLKEEYYCLYVQQAGEEEVLFIEKGETATAISTNNRSICEVEFFEKHAIYNYFEKICIFFSEGYWLIIPSDDMALARKLARIAENLETSGIEHMREKLHKQGILFHKEVA